MLKDKANKIDAREVKKNGPKKDRPEYYVDKINNSWVTSKDKYDTKELNSSDMCAAVRLAMMQSKKTGRNFVILLGIAEEVITGVKKEFGIPAGPSLKN